MKTWFLCVLVAAIFVMAPLGGISLHSTDHNLMKGTSATANDDLDPLVDLALQVIVQRARKIAVVFDQEPSFSVQVTVGGETWVSDALQGYDVWNVGSSTWFDIPDDQSSVSVTIEVLEGGQVMDVSPEGETLSLTYDVFTDDWTGDDFRQDDSGYGHASGTEDGESTDRDYEIWFDISFNDYDGDGLTYWEEVNVYGTNPQEDDTGIDYDNDGVPIEWEDHWGYDSLQADSHATLDPDQDGLQNTEEYMMGQWLADPFRQDIYIEVDTMAPSEDGVHHEMPQESIQHLYSTFTAHHIMLLIDDGMMGGSDEIPYSEALDYEQLNQVYETYFRASSPERVGVFHHAIICHEIVFWRRPAGGMNFKRDSFVIGSGYIQKWRPTEPGMKTAHASLFLHELGHSIGLNNYFGVDNEHSRFPWQLQYWLLGNYKSCMNYRYAFTLIDYSDGTHGFLDYDDWGSLDLQRFTH